MSSSSDQSLLDADELLHLALAASQKGKSEEAITFLKRALERAPKDARLHYMLGAEHAQIGLYERATEEIKKAVELDPSLDTAHFQLGLLYITSGQAEAAAEAWKPLDKLNHDHFLYLFKTGLLHLAKDEFAQCIEHLRRGIAANKFNAALNNDMLQIAKEAELRAAAAPTPAATPAASSPTAPKAPKNVVLSNYRKNRKDDKDKDNEAK